MTRIRASNESALAISTVCCWATESSRTREPGEIAPLDAAARPAASAVASSIARLSTNGPARRLAAEKDVLGDRPLREEVELLVDDADAPLLRLPRVAEADLLAVEEDRSRRRVDRRRRGSSSGCSCRRRSRRRRHGPRRPQIEVDLAEHRHAEEALGDAAHLEQRRGWLAGNLGRPSACQAPTTAVLRPSSGVPCPRPQCHPARRARRAPSPRRP